MRADDGADTLNEPSHCATCNRMCFSYRRFIKLHNIMIRTHEMELVPNYHPKNYHNGTVQEGCRIAI